MASFDRLIRFRDGDGAVHHGNLSKELAAIDLIGREVAVVKGDLEQGYVVTTETAMVYELLCPLERVPVFLWVGLNYAKHVKETGLTLPSYPTIFMKPSDALTGPLNVITVHPDAHEMLDYEGELTVVVGKDAKDVKANEAIDYVLGYTCGNDVSARNFQLAGTSGDQFCYAKSFDSFAPIGPCIASPKVIPDPHQLQLTTRVEGQVRQQTETSDMVWKVGQLIEHLSRGTTIRKGTCIMTGTPSGAGLFMEPPRFLHDNDVVEVEISGIGSISNTFLFSP